DHEDAAQAFAEFVEVVRRLRAPGGCPWDREQTPATLKPFIVEESYEVIDAIDSGKSKDICEELGDLLLQIGLQSQLAAEQGEFDIADVARGITAKLIHRHPHVFGDVKVDGSGEVLKNWEQLKKQEKKDRGLFDGLPSQMPVLQKAARIGEKAGRVGFDWTDALAVRKKVAEELAELDEAVAHGDVAAMEHEIGDLLFAVAQWARHLGLAPEEALRACCGRFQNRFEQMTKLIDDDGHKIAELSVDQLESFWQRAKAAVR
ncbi:MAG: nucleoside triphosphate pyrophosphohydrolase, partial [Deltaproteobacteria bacterium]|nr:nucleoside triphosphate pyrophosphohydrolase [Deltaproteobacteria bacterium]